MLPVLWLPAVLPRLLGVHLWDTGGMGWRGLSWHTSSPALSHHQPLFPAPLPSFRLSSLRVGKDLGFTFSPLGISVMLSCRGSQAAAAS